MAAEDPIVKETEDRLEHQRGRSIQLEFPKGRTSHVLTLTPHQAHVLKAKLDRYLWALRVENLERDLDQADYEGAYDG